MTDRAQALLRASGTSEVLLAALERDDALFALTDDALLYQDGGGVRRVTLRDLTRIHSDQEGMLRVETPAGTALTASLLGFDPAGVQTFFSQVRDTTARAKQQPTSPLPTGGSKTFGTATAAQAPSAPTSTPAAMPVVPASRAVPAPSETAAAGSALTGSTPAPPSAPQGQGVTAAVGAAVQSEGHTTGRPPTPSAVVISGSGFSPSTPRTPVSTPAPALRPAEAAPVPVTQAPVTPAVPLPTEAAPSLQSDGSAVSRLLEQAEVVSGLVGRLRVLGIVLGLSAIALAVFLFLGDQRLSGMWTLIAGGVGAIALLSLAELARLLSLLAQAAASPSQEA